MQTVSLVSESRQMDASLVALTDAAAVCVKVRKWLVVGGFMVNLHILRSGLDRPLRLTRDADVAVPLRTIRQGELLARITHLGYRNAVYPNRFDRVVDGLEAQIDLLTTSYSTKHEPNRDGDHIALDGMPAVDEALHRDPVVLDVRYQRSDGVAGQATVRIPDVVSAVAMKTFAVAERSNPNDARDLGYLLEVAATDPPVKHWWPRGKAYAAARVQLGAQFVAPGVALPLAAEDPAHQERLRGIARQLVG